ncbi:SHC SH2 domain-binding protein 1 [Plecturocebus cupreus]
MWVKGTKLIKFWGSSVQRDTVIEINEEEPSSLSESVDLSHRLQGSGTILAHCSLCSRLKPSSYLSFEQLVLQATDVDISALKAVVQLAEPYLCESGVSTLNLECMKELLELKKHQLPLQELGGSFWLLCAK